MMGDSRSKEDHVHQIATSIYVTNFPKHFSSRDLWKNCQEYGREINAYISNRRTKSGDRFGFVRFNRIKDVDRLVKNLCTLWMGRLRLHANVARFQRPPLNKAQHVKGANVGYKSSVGCRELLEKFKSHVVVGSWFSSLEYASNSFVIDERVVWVDIEGVPMKIWMNNTFNKISSKWRELLFEEDRKNMYLFKVSGWIPNFLEEDDKEDESDDDMLDNESDGEKNEEDLQAYSVKECNSDVVPDMKPNNDNKEEESSKATLKYPPGFTSDDVLRRKDVQDVVEEVEATSEVQKVRKTGGSILRVMEDLVKAGQTMSYKMEGLTQKAKKDWVKELCNKNKVNFLSLQKTKMEMIDNFCVKNYWDYFIAIQGDWIPNAKRYLIISVYAPQEASEKRMLWSYLNHVIERWNGETILIGDFNEVCLYKIIAKILANRLVGVLGDLVSEVQSAFIVNRQILDGPFILDELIHWCNSKKKETIIFKIDFKKAYDSVRWDYLDDVLNKFGFGLKWRNRINNCLNSSKGSILVNGSPTREFHFRKGLKQGQWFISNINTLVQALDRFYKASGLRMNLHKSKLMGISVEDELVSKAAIKMGCSTLKTPISYLGIKVGGLMSRIKAWDEIAVKFIRAVHGNSRGIEMHSRVSYSSTWLTIVNEVNNLRNKGIDLLIYMKIKVGNGLNTKFWKDVWMGNNNFKTSFPRIYALESEKKHTVVSKMIYDDVGFSLRRQPRDGVEMEQFRALTTAIEGVLLHDMIDRWKWSLEGSSEFSVVSARKLIDDNRLLSPP
uniref:RNA-directed DNA polymerase, eukaryota, reverse transcriptase zinc-binding domain protein n=1 Tax=Tanacetum cinerariifolium TaxID=118510 RepID=A0A6L2J7A6_TANCI|nr:RNA-directed DNA polymerase, eukaryota, reverse transcriptase zinc-binding domain protein [Tanacetum cinerariifolium]